MSISMHFPITTRALALTLAPKPLSVLTLIRPKPGHHLLLPLQLHGQVQGRHASTSTRKARVSPGLRAAAARAKTPSSTPTPLPPLAPPATTSTPSPAASAPAVAAPSTGTVADPAITAQDSSPSTSIDPAPAAVQQPPIAQTPAPVANSKAADPTPSPADPQSKANPSATSPAPTEPTASGWSIAAITQFAKDALSQTRNGFIKLYTDTRKFAHYKMDHWEKNGTSFSATAAATLVTPSRREVRFLAQVKQDWMRFVPFMVYLAVPFSAFTLPIIIRFAPGMLPTGFRGHRIQEMMDHSTLTMQATLGPDLAKVIVDKLDKCREEIAQSSTMEFQHTIVRRMVNDRETQAQYSEILATLPLLRIHLNFGKFDYIDAIKMASFCRITLPFLFPKARLVRRMSIIRQDDALLVRERFAGLSHEEIVEACRMRQLPIPSKEEGPISDEEMLELLKEHARFTERLEVADVPAFVFARVLKAYYVYE